MSYPADDDVTLNVLSRTVHQWAIEKGWWEAAKPRTVGDLIALMHSELSEALEEFRDGHQPNEIYYSYGAKGAQYHSTNRTMGPKDKLILGKPEGIPIELADVIIRIADFCGRYGIDLEDAIRQKMAYNAIRPYRHGPMDGVGQEGKAL